MTKCPWLILGDFNSILTVEDRINGAHVHQNEVIDFNQCIEDIGVGLINKKGIQYSCSNKRGAEDRIYSHIDWVFGNADWFGVYAGIEAVYLVPGCSDHTPILLNTEDINDDHLNPNLIEQEKKVLMLIEKWDAVYEKILRQKSRAIWIKHGDSYTKYFHAQLKARQARNKFTSICTEQNVRVTDPKQIHQEFIQFFKKLLGEAAPVMTGIDVTIEMDPVYH
ncbi:PREDICTED: uncharacterized protein LOC109209031 [Nicotiana attenuata]|uniref:uncharacterized protein LOC109209031 n=1 Tax=Nicotiana attenuata TaxID=49451 RepID=UPI00090554AB|nr:PREDICTED: uncharacterized protein LOC109209031 [Nicotiana attenuata]